MSLEIIPISDLINVTHLIIHVIATVTFVFPRSKIIGVIHENKNKKSSGSFE